MQGAEGTVSSFWLAHDTEEDCWGLLFWFMILVWIQRKAAMCQLQTLMYLPYKPDGSQGCGPLFFSFVWSVKLTCSKTLLWLANQETEIKGMTRPALFSWMNLTESLAGRILPGYSPHHIQMTGRHIQTLASLLGFELNFGEWQDLAKKWQYLPWNFLSGFLNALSDKGSECARWEVLTDKVSSTTKFFLAL